LLIVKFREQRFTHYFLEERTRAGNRNSIKARQALSTSFGKADGGQVSFSGCLRLLNATSAESLLALLVV